MKTIQIKDKKNTRMVAHRGLSGIERENSVSAFVAAGNRDYFGIECDVHVTKDGKYVIYHDDTTGRLCEKDLRIEETDYEELSRLRLLASGKTAGYDRIHQIPTLQEYLEVCARYDKVAVIELKNAMIEKNIAEIIEICKAEYDLSKIIFISFAYENLVTVRKLLPQQKLQYLVDFYTEDLIDKLKQYNLDLDINYRSLTADRVKVLHDKGIVINCWTCDNADSANNLIAWGVDFITSNILQ